jgi:hypothetical protein
MTGRTISLRFGITNNALPETLPYSPLLYLSSYPSVSLCIGDTQMQGLSIWERSFPYIHDFSGNYDRLSE